MDEFEHGVAARLGTSGVGLFAGERSTQCAIGTVVPYTDAQYRLQTRSSTARGRSLRATSERKIYRNSGDTVGNNCYGIASNARRSSASQEELRFSRSVNKVARALTGTCAARTGSIFPNHVADPSRALYADLPR